MTPEVTEFAVIFASFNSCNLIFNHSKLQRL